MGCSFLSVVGDGGPVNAIVGRQDRGQVGFSNIHAASTVDSGSAPPARKIRPDRLFCALEGIA
jgi:hypothetical protein